MTKVFLDTASANEIREFLSWGIGDGVTTNQKIFLTEGNVDFKARVLELCGLKKEWPVSVETTTKGFDDLVGEAREYLRWHKDVVVNVAMDKDGVGLRVVKKLPRRSHQDEHDGDGGVQPPVPRREGGGDLRQPVLQQGQGRRSRPHQDRPRDRALP